MSSRVRCTVGDRDALMVGDVLGIEGTRTVQADPRDPAPGRGGGHLRARRVVLQEVPVDGGAEMAEHRALAAGQDRREPPALAGEHRAADGVDAAVDPAQAARPSRARPRRCTEPQRPQLRQRHHPPLPRSERRDRLSGGVLPNPRISRGLQHTPRACQAARDSGTPQTHQICASRARREPHLKPSRACSTDCPRRDGRRRPGPPRACGRAGVEAHGCHRGARRHAGRGQLELRAALRRRGPRA